MQPKNKYYRRSHISEQRMRQVLKYFAQDLSASDVAHLTGLTRKTVNSIFLRIRQRIAEDSAAESTAHRPTEDSTVTGVGGNDELRNFIQRRLQKFKGISPSTYQLHMRECEWRFSRRDRSLYEELLVLLREHPL